MFFFQDPEATQMVYPTELAVLKDLVKDYTKNKITIIKWLRMAINGAGLKDAKEYYERYQEIPELLVKSFYAPSSIHEEKHLNTTRLVREFRGEVEQIKRNLDGLVHRFVSTVMEDVDDDSAL